MELVQPRRGPLGAVGAGSSYSEVRLTVALWRTSRQDSAVLLGSLRVYGSHHTGNARARLQVPGDEFPVDFAAPNYADAKPVHSEIHDPGSGVVGRRS